jgi:hypothetical protein
MIALYGCGASQTRTVEFMDRETQCRIIGAKWESFATHLPNNSQGATSSAVVDEFNTLLKLTRTQLPDIAPYLPKDVDTDSAFGVMNVCPIDAGDLKALAMQVVSVFSAAYPRR